MTKRTRALCTAISVALVAVRAERGEKKNCKFVLNNDYFFSRFLSLVPSRSLSRFQRPSQNGAREKKHAVLHSVSYYIADVSLFFRSLLALNDKSSTHDNYCTRAYNNIIRRSPRHRPSVNGPSVARYGGGRGDFIDDSLRTHCS